ncbi:hypothetical protein DPEC_G00144130 [Dallia pectoralis]|uniref:Uncharacterized protein n=1 Tax=Dallia pectoralis TaxID=75939 RepID=A0ACC2GNS1_DALPE|nr:hypothetical protein DPEC_G00144130 [Dallia pectoralis]
MSSKSKESPRSESLCDFCPKGQYARTQCTGSEKTKCKVCPHELYTDVSNILSQCLSCRVCYPNNNQRVLAECMASSDRQCECVTGFYCRDDGCEHCLHVKVCPMGSGVLTPATGRNDTVCAPCPHGTFSNVTDALTKCRPHTSCAAMGKEIKIAGTDRVDVVCGDFLSGCPWILPASLWAGLAVTLLVFILIGIYWRSKRQSYITDSSDVDMSKGTALLPFPSPKLNYPIKCWSENQETPDEKGTEPHFLNTAVIQINDCMSRCLVEADGTTVSIEPSEPVSLPDHSTIHHNRINIGLTSSQSEPQEDEWPGT